MTDKTGGPAFPVNYDHQIFAAKDTAESRRLMSGMSLRDYFAAKVMQGHIASGGDIDIHGDYLCQKRAEVAYAVADAMLKAREINND